MFARQFFVGLTLIGSIFALQDCCYLEPDHAEGGMRYRSNSLDDVFYDNVPADGNGSMCGIEITRDPNDEDNCAAVSMGGYYGYCNGVEPKPVTCTADYVVKTNPDPVKAKPRRRRAERMS